MLSRVPAITSTRIGGFAGEYIPTSRVASRISIVSACKCRACGAITMENLTAFDLEGNNGGRRYLLAQLFRRRAAGEI